MNNLSLTRGGIEAFEVVRPLLRNRFLNIILLNKWLVLKKNSIGVPLLVFALFSVAFPFIPASADEEDDINFLQSLLAQSSDQVNNQISELEEAGIPIPSSVDLFYSQGLAEYDAALEAIEYGNLEGQEGVYIETRMGFDVDGVEIKARHDFAAKAIDHRGVYKNAGA